MSEALNEALREEMRRDDGVFVIGEDIGRHGGLFKVTDGLLAEFGPARVIDSPISEAAISGAGVGAALVGARPVVELQISDFITLTMDQVVNHAAKWRYMSGGQVSVPFVIRGPISNGIGMAAQHSQSLESWFVHTPGPDRRDAGDAARRERPAEGGDPRGQPRRLPREAPALRQEGPGAGDGLRRSRSAAPTSSAPAPTSPSSPPGRPCRSRCRPRGSSRARARARGDRRTTLKPLDADTIAESIAKTGRLVVVNEGPLTGGYASRSSRAWSRRSASTRSARHPPASRRRTRRSRTPTALEREVLPTVDDLVAAVNAMTAA